MKWQDTYIKARTGIRDINRKIVSEKNYEHITSPNHKKRVYNNFNDIKTRVNILFTIPYLKKDGKKIMDLGDTQTILELICFFNDKFDYSKGIDTTLTVGTRYGVGNLLVDSGLCNKIYEKMENDPKIYLKMLQEGNYHSFMKYFLDHVENSMKEIKK